MEDNMGLSGLHENKSSLLSHQEVMQFFMEQGKLVTFQKGQAICTPGTAADRIYLVNHGEIKVSRGTNDGKEIILDLLGPGDIFGEAEAITGAEWKNSIITKKDCILHAISREALATRMSKDCRIAMWLMQRIGSKQLETENLLENLLFKSANAKVAQVLLELAKHYGKASGEGTLIDYLITHQEIGNTIATTRETVSYAFMEFRQMGLIDTIKRRTVIKDLTGLEALAAAS
jgi:CRP/FNR family transcriptional regulator